MYVDVHLIMNKVMTVTQLRKSLFSVVEATKVNKQITNIMLHGEVVAQLVPKSEEKIDWIQYKIDLKKAVTCLRNSGWKENKEFRKNFKFKQW